MRLLKPITKKRWNDSSFSRLQKRTNPLLPVLGGAVLNLCVQAGYHQSGYEVREGDMCLHSLTNFRVRKMEGYKVFHIIGGKLYSLLRGTHEPIPKRKWVNERDWNIGIISTDLPYTVGWHICATKKGTRLWAGKIYKVEFRNVVAKGTQDGHNVIVAQEMLILGEV